MASASNGNGFLSNGYGSVPQGQAAPAQEEKINTDIVTLTRFLTEEQAKHKEATGDFTYAF